MNPQKMSRNHICFIAKSCCLTNLMRITRHLGRFSPISNIICLAIVMLLGVRATPTAVGMAAGVITICSSEQLPFYSDFWFSPCTGSSGGRNTSRYGIDARCQVVLTPWIGGCGRTYELAVTHIDQNASTNIMVKVNISAGFGQTREVSLPTNSGQLRFNLAATFGKPWARLCLILERSRQP
jgi:hypothetical protein